MMFFVIDVVPGAAIGFICKITFCCDLANINEDTETSIFWKDISFFFFLYKSPDFSLALVTSVLLLLISHFYVSIVNCEISFA